jgi:hypothetical protein
MKLVKIILLISYCAWLLAACDGSKKNEQKPESSYSGLVELLLANKIDQFYEAVKKEDLLAVRMFFTTQAAAGKKFNYGVLVNADLIDQKNRAALKPDIKKVDMFMDVANKSNCFMNSAFYAVANSAFFDDFLEIDKLFSKDWENRDSKNLPKANAVLRSLREIIYEIRLGPNTNSSNIDLMRKRHLDALEHIGNMESIVDFYYELVTSYNFKQGFRHTVKDGKNEQAHFPVENFKDKPQFASLFKPMVRKVQGIYGLFSLLSCNIHVGMADWMYLDAIFAVVDPWGKIARYMALAVIDKDYDGRLVINDPYPDRDPLMVSYKQDKIQFIHNIPPTEAGLDFWKPIIARLLLNPISQQINGYVEYHKWPLDLPKFNLVAKTKGKESIIHQIVELFRYARHKWETQDFFGPPTFSTEVSHYETGGYKDFTKYFEIKNND